MCCIKESFWNFFIRFIVEKLCYLIVIIGCCHGVCNRENWLFAEIIRSNQLLQPSNNFGNLTGDALDLALINKIDSELKLHQQANLEKLKITKISKNVFRNFTKLREILLKINQISEIEDGAFEKNKKLEIIDLMDNNLTKITRNIFSGTFNDLIEIKLSYNFIDYVETGSFDDCPSLETVDFSHNCLQRLGSGLFRKNQAIRFAYFIDNAITKVELNVFNSKTDLKYLDLMRNNLAEIPQLELKKIGELSLSHNEIKIFDLNFEDSKKSPTIDHLKISHNLITECTELEEHRNDLSVIDLSFNFLTHIDEFPSLLSLEILTLSNNNISDLSLYNFGEKFPNLKILNIRDIKLNCSDFIYLRNNLSPLIVNVETEYANKCLHSHNSNDFEDDYYLDSIIAKVVADTKREITHNLTINRALLILILLLIAFISSTVFFVALNFRIKLSRKSSELLQNMEM